MHYKAGILALHGLVPTMFGVGGLRGFRARSVTNIRKYPRAYYLGLSESPAHWVVGTCTVPERYFPVEWDEVPDAVWDQLDMALLDEFMEKDRAS